ncbi:hypothetical protein [Caulobacter sp. UC70_42]|uniref:hypothetical protein n=1 Tax=Caulobacter sp. UC70_42 TaxID=3374551 RepID=UPI0037567BC0
MNSAYYQSFDTVNRFINFAVNLGKNGERRRDLHGHLRVPDPLRRHQESLCDHLRRGAHRPKGP